MSLAAMMQITDQDVRTVSASRGGELLGQTAGTSDGRMYAYGLNGTGSGTALAPGKVMQGAVTTANYYNRTGVTYAAGTNSVTFTLGTTAAFDLFAGGYLVVNAGTGAGQALLIIGNTAATAGNSNSTTLLLKDAIITATLASDSKFSIQPNIYSKAVLAVHATPSVAAPLGVPNVSIPDANYGWFQVGGTASVLADASTWVTVADDLIVSSLTDGAVGIETTSTITPRIGYALMQLVSTEYRSVFLTINCA